MQPRQVSPSSAACTTAHIVDSKRHPLHRPSTSTSRPSISRSTACTRAVVPALPGLYRCHLVPVSCGYFVHASAPQPPSTLPAAAGSNHRPSLHLARARASPSLWLSSGQQRAQAARPIRLLLNSDPTRRPLGPRLVSAPLLAPHAPPPSPPSPCGCRAPAPRSS